MFLNLCYINLESANKRWRIDIVKNWPKPKFVRNILVFLGFANFNQCFIQKFSRIAQPLTLILQTKSINLSSILELSIDIEDNDEFIGNGSNKTRILSIFSRSHKLTKVGYLMFSAKKAFNYLRYTFTQALIL